MNRKYITEIYFNIDESFDINTESNLCWKNMIKIRVEYY